MTGRDMTDEQVRAELERIDPDYSFTWDVHTKDLRCGGCPVEKALRRLAESQHALGDCIAIMEQFDPDMDAPRLLEYNADLSGQIEIARTAWKGGKS